MRDVLERGTRIRTDSFVALASRAATTTPMTWSVRRPTLRAELAHGDALRFTAELGRWDHRAPAGGPYATIDGNGSVDETRGMVGLRLRLVAAHRMGGWRPVIRRSMAMVATAVASRCGAPG